MELELLDPVSAVIVMPCSIYEEITEILVCEFSRRLLHELEIVGAPSCGAWIQRGQS